MADLTDRVNQDMNENLENLFAEEEEAIDAIDEINFQKKPKTKPTENLRPRVAKAATATKDVSLMQKRANQVAFAKELSAKIRKNNDPARDVLLYGGSALTFTCAAALLAFYMKRKNAVSDFDEDFHRI